MHGFSLQNHLTRLPRGDSGGYAEIQQPACMITHFVMRWMPTHCALSMRLRSQDQLRKRTLCNMGRMG